MNFSNINLEKLEDLAESLEDAGDLQNALDCWRYIVVKQKSIDFLCQYGRVAYEVDNDLEAEQAFLSAIDISSPMGGMNVSHLVGLAYVFLGLIYIDRGQFDIAETYFNQSLDFGENAGKYTLLGVTHFNQGNDVQAQENFYKAINADLNYEEAYYNLALTYRNNQISKSIELLNKALEIDENYGLAHREMGWCLRHLGKYSEGLNHLKKALEIIPSDGWSYVYYGNTLWVTEDFVSAEEAFNKVIEIWPDDSIGYWCLAMFMQYQDRPEEAESLFKKGFEIDSEDVETNLRFGIFLKEIGQIDRAKFHLERVLNFEPTYKRPIQELESLQH